MDELLPTNWKGELRKIQEELLTFKEGTKLPVDPRSSLNLHYNEEQLLFRKEDFNQLIENRLIRFGSWNEVNNYLKSCETSNELFAAYVSLGLLHLIVIKFSPEMIEYFLGFSPNQLNGLTSGCSKTNSECGPLNYQRIFDTLVANYREKAYLMYIYIINLMTQIFMHRNTDTLGHKVKLEADMIPCDHIIRQIYVRGSEHQRQFYRLDQVLMDSFAKYRVSLSNFNYEGSVIKTHFRHWDFFFRELAFATLDDLKILAQGMGGLWLTDRHFNGRVVSILIVHRRYEILEQVITELASTFNGSYHPDTVYFIDSLFRIMWSISILGPPNLSLALMLEEWLLNCSHSTIVPLGGEKVEELLESCLTTQLHRIKQLSSERKTILKYLIINLFAESPERKKLIQIFA